MSNGQLYAGFTHDLKRRMQEHQNGGIFTTSKYLPIQLIFYESFLRKTDAERREKYFKTSKGKSTLQLMLKDTLRK